VGLGGPVLACVGGARGANNPLDGYDAEGGVRVAPAEGISRISYIINKHSVVRIHSTILPPSTHSVPDFPAPSPFLSFVPESMLGLCHRPHPSKRARRDGVSEMR
jgi:hypothetical protein